VAKILVVGCGDIGGVLAENLVNDGNDVTGLRRTIPEKKTAVKYLSVDVANTEQVINLSLNFDQVIYILSPESGDIAAYEVVFSKGVDNVLNAFKSKNPTAAFTFVSSSRVYGQQNGEWINEESITTPTDERGKILVQAERKFLAFNQHTTIVRFSGIYGRSNYLQNQIINGISIQKAPPYYTNRIHKEDCIGALAFVVEQKSKGRKLDSIYIASDHEPATKWDVACYLADKLKVSAPQPLTRGDEANSNKRLDNARLVSAGYQFKVKSYKQGY
jgi:nucleoside-diphosphate-sugar epimerase